MRRGASSGSAGSAGGWMVERQPVQCPMARYTLVYGVRLIPEGTLARVDDTTLHLADGSTAGLTLHTFDGTIPQLRRSLDRSLDAFFDLLPGADREDVETFGQ